MIIQKISNYAFVQLVLCDQKMRHNLVGTLSYVLSYETTPKVIGPPSVGRVVLVEESFWLLYLWKYSTVLETDRHPGIYQGNGENWFLIMPTPKTGLMTGSVHQCWPVSICTKQPFGVLFNIPKQRQSVPTSLASVSASLGQFFL